MRFAGIVLSTVLSICGAPALAQSPADYPSRAIRIIVPLSEINKKNYDTLVGFVHEQVLTGRRPTLADLFPKEAFSLELPLPRMHQIDYRF
jgi:hypothetical protein